MALHDSVLYYVLPSIEFLCNSDTDPGIFSS